ncbi:hypothetical protein EXW49_15350 [Bacillus mycoides]|nr:hypothetical protein EXW60_26115 [Bacillus mycoides]QWG92705.1 hypothetical protein EXW40_15405 [Bacillus mycoides]QWH09408.1 hypothetical protein EXW49_15350 [Bacillus mycoides]QWJ08894.1 hypothetical protein J5V76_15085 [Bacillus mycoides]
MIDALKYVSSSRDKPFKAYKHITENWDDNKDSVNSQWKNIIEGLSISSVKGEAFKAVASTIEGFFKEQE